MLATNVAETSLTGAGHPLRDRHRHGARQALQLRNKVEQLLVEPISQAAANQRAWAAAGAWPTASASACTTKDFAAADRFTDPEILRSSLAGVILRMKALPWGRWKTSPS